MFLPPHPSDPPLTLPELLRYFKVKSIDQLIANFQPTHQQSSQTLIDSLSQSSGLHAQLVKKLLIQGKDLISSAKYVPTHESEYAIAMESCIQMMTNCHQLIPIDQMGPKTNIITHNTHNTDTYFRSGDILQIIGRPNTGKSTLMATLGICAAKQDSLQVYLLSSNVNGKISHKLIERAHQTVRNRIVAIQYEGLAELAMLIHIIGNQCSKRRVNESQSRVNDLGQGKNRQTNATDGRSTISNPNNNSNKNDNNIPSFLLLIDSLTPPHCPSQPDQSDPSTDLSIMQKLKRLIQDFSCRVGGVAYTIRGGKGCSLWGHSNSNANNVNSTNSNYTKSYHNSYNSYIRPSAKTSTYLSHIFQSISHHSLCIDMVIRVEEPKDKLTKSHDCVRRLWRYSWGKSLFSAGDIYQIAEGQIQSKKV